MRACVTALLLLILAAPGALAAQGGPRDLDGDGIRNARDRDVDGDGIRNRRDRDIDGDGVENPWDIDSDSSGDASVGTGGAAPRVWPGFFGLVSDDAFWGTDSHSTRSKPMAAIARTGARVLRQAFSWAMIERAPGRFDFHLYDDYVAAAARQGLALLPILFDPPPFRSSRPPGGAGGVYPPASNADFAGFARLLVGRYGPGGEFWRAHPELPQRPITSWQVWNEPNLRRYWPAGPDPAAYAAMLEAVAPAIRSADPGARVVTAGLSDQGVPLTRFLRGMYRAGARGSFDALAVHAYAPASDLVVDQVRRAARGLRRAHDGARMLVTELGWPTGGPQDRALAVDEDAQAALVSRTVARLVRLRRRLRLDGVYYFNWRDALPAPGASDHWGLHTGLLRADGSPKPALFALTRAVREFSSR